jgi:hypothetical protein
MSSFVFPRKRCDATLVKLRWQDPGRVMTQIIWIPIDAWIHGLMDLLHLVRVSRVGHGARLAAGGALAQQLEQLLIGGAKF